MNENGNLTPLIPGSWDWIETAIPNGCRWEIIRRFLPHEHYWNFTSDGYMKSYVGGELCYAVGWRYKPAEKILILDGCEIDRRQRCQFIIYEFYKVEISETRMILFDQENFMDMAGCRLRLTFERITKIPLQ